MRQLHVCELTTDRTTFVAVLHVHADCDLQPEMLVALPWDNVRRFFVEQEKVLGKDWFEK
jgi:hypothetical protein